MSEHITSADASIYLTCETLYPAGFRVQNFSADLALGTEDLTLAEVRMGVDGHLAAGYTPAPISVNLTVEANSPSRPHLEHIAEASRLNMTVYECDLQVTIPGIGKVYSFKKGYMTGGHIMPDVKKTLDPTQWKFTFESVESSSI